MAIAAFEGLEIASDCLVARRGRSRRHLGHGRPGLGPAVALGELEPGFGNHPALLGLSENGRTLRRPVRVFPSDHGYRRTVPDVAELNVAVAAASSPPSAAPAAGSVVCTRRDKTTLSASTLARLRTHTLTVTFQAGTTPQQHVESGPTVAEVLRAGHVHIRATTAVSAVDSDGYLATITPGEARSGGRLLLVSTVEDGTPLTQPRLITDGNGKGGRYGADVVALLVSGACCR